MSLFRVASDPSVSASRCHLPALRAGRNRWRQRFLPYEAGEVTPSYGAGGVMSPHRASDPSVADYRATSPYEWGGK